MALLFCHFIVFCCSFTFAATQSAALPWSHFQFTIDTWECSFFGSYSSTTSHCVSVGCAVIIAWGALNGWRTTQGNTVSIMSGTVSSHLHTWWRALKEHLLTLISVLHLLLSSNLSFCVHRFFLICIILYLIFFKKNKVRFIKMKIKKIA